MGSNERCAELRKEKEWSERDKSQASSGAQGKDGVRERNIGVKPNNISMCAHGKQIPG